MPVTQMYDSGHACVVVAPHTRAERLQLCVSLVGKQQVALAFERGLKINRALSIA